MKNKKYINKYNTDDGTEIDTIQDLVWQINQLKADISNIKYFLRNPNKYQDWD
jgi:hypothetical protein